jgi:hypothetical protein
MGLSRGEDLTLSYFISRSLFTAFLLKTLAGEVAGKSDGSTSAVETSTRQAEPALDIADVRQVGEITSPPRNLATHVTSQNRLL